MTIFLVLFLIFIFLLATVFFVVMSLPSKTLKELETKISKKNKPDASIPPDR